MTMEEQLCIEQNSTTPITFNVTHELTKDKLKPCLALTIVATIGILGNVLAFFTVTTRKFKHLSFSVYILFLNLADITNLLATTVPYVLEFIFEAHPSSVTGIRGFLALHFFSQTAQMVSSWMMVAISVDRFIVVVHPLKRFRLCTKKKATITSVVILLISSIFIGVEVITAYITNGETFCDFWEISEFGSISKLRGLVLTLVVPAIVGFGLNIKVFKVVKEMYTVRRQLSESRQDQTECNNSHLKVTLALTILTAMSSVLFIPVILIDIMDAIQVENHTGGKSAIVRRQCVGELIYIVDISLHFYILVLILFGYRKSCLICISKPFNRFKIMFRSTQSPGKSHCLESVGQADVEKQTDRITMHM